MKLTQNEFYEEDEPLLSDTNEFQERFDELFQHGNGDLDEDEAYQIVIDEFEEKGIDILNFTSFIDNSNDES